MTKRSITVVSAESVDEFVALDFDDADLVILCRKTQLLWIKLFKPFVHQICFELSAFGVGDRAIVNQQFGNRSGGVGR